MANKTLNTRQKQVFRAPTPPVSRGQQPSGYGKKARPTAPEPKPASKPAPKPAVRKTGS